MDTDAIVSWAESKARPPAAEPIPSKYERLTRSDIGVLFKLSRDGVSQAEIAKRLGCSQPTVNMWCQQFTDTTAEAKTFLRSSALRMAENIVKKGRAADHVATLKGINVLQDDANIGVTIMLGGALRDVNTSELVTIAQTVTEAGADNPTAPSYRNESEQ